MSQAGSPSAGATPADAARLAGRIEVGPSVGVGRATDGLERPYFGGGVGLHVSDVLSFEVAGAATPAPTSFGPGEWRTIDFGLGPTPGASVAGYADVTARFAVASGTVGRRERVSFQLYPMLGVGIAATRDDLEELGCAGVEGTACVSSASQVLPTAVLGGGLRVLLPRDLAVRVEGRSVGMVETLGDNTLRAGALLGVNVGVTWMPRLGGGDGRERKEDRSPRDRDEGFGPCAGAAGVLIEGAR